MTIFLFCLLFTILILTVVFTPKGVTFIRDQIQDVKDNTDKNTQSVNDNTNQACGS